MSPASIRYPPGFEPTAGQAEAINEVLHPSRQVTVIAGPGGTGKTSLLPAIASNVDPSRIRVQTPTGKTAVRVRQVFQQAGVQLHPARVSTIHAATYGQVDATVVDSRRRLKFSKAHAPAGENDVVFIDEGSMVGAKVWMDYTRCLRPKTRVVLLGDPCQLDPVGDKPAVDLMQPTVMLTEIMRQALLSGIRRAANTVRIGSGVKTVKWPKIAEAADVWYSTDRYIVSFDDLDDSAGDDCLFLSGCNVGRAADFVVEARMHGDDAVFVAFTNQSVETANLHIARQLRANRTVDIATAGDPACKNYAKAASIAIGDRLIGRRNNYDLGWMNGEVLTVRGVEVRTIGTGFDVVALDLWGDERRAVLPLTGSIYDEECTKHDRLLPPNSDASFVICSRGEAVTVHRFQGSEADSVLFYVDGAANSLRDREQDSWRRLVYTGASRACRRLVVAGDLR